MCGIVGILERNAGIDRGLLLAMRDRLEHRGPDDAGIWIEGNVGLGHRRLSVIDLSREGHQPMASCCGRYWIVYNGEIYNFDELRSSLPDVTWRGHSDTEVLVAAIAVWGIEPTLRRLSGMFAFAVYDRQRRELTLARDALGIKPLYYGWCGNRFVFGSELSAFDVLASSDRRVSRDALATYLRYGNIPAPHSIYEGIAKLQPGTFVRVAAGDLVRKHAPASETFWSARDLIAQDRRPMPDDAIEAETLQLLRNAVKHQLFADVRLGAFLSGGIDSSLVVALMQEQSHRPVRTFTIGFEQSAFDEAAAAKRVAAHLGTDHCEHVMSERELLDAVEQLSALCDEPFGDSSILPTYLVSRFAREHVTVCLSGDGGDELAWGYARYRLCDSVWPRIERIPHALRVVLGRILASRTARIAGRRVPMPSWLGRGSRVAERLDRISGLLSHQRQSDMYLDLVSHTLAPEGLVIEGEEFGSIYRDQCHWSASLPMWRRMPVQDLLTYLPDDILTKTDRASMRVGLELRVPLLDQPFVEHCLALPESALHRGGDSKRILKRILARFVPTELVDRPKQGFSVPLAQWLRGPLRDWAIDLLSPSRLAADGYLQADIVTARLHQHLRHEADWSANLWDLLVFQQWLQARSRASFPVAAK